MHIRVHVHLCVLVRQSWVFFPEAIFLLPPPQCPSLLWDLPHSLDWLTSGATWIYLFLSPQLFIFLFKCGSEDWTQVLSALPMECFPGPCSFASFQHFAFRSRLDLRWKLSAGCSFEAQTPLEVQWCQDGEGDFWNLKVCVSSFALWQIGCFCVLLCYTA